MTSVTWAEAADLLETFLEETSRLVDGEDIADQPDLGEFTLTGDPEPEDIERVERLLADANDAMHALALRRAEIQQELDHTTRLRTAGAGYLRYQ